jgi:hypothetical protein
MKTLFLALIIGVALLVAVFILNSVPHRTAEIGTYFNEGTAHAACDSGSAVSADIQ